MTRVSDAARGRTTRGGAPAASRVHLDNFTGPFDLLLQLISRHKLDITEVALSRVTDEFIAHIKAGRAGLGPGPDQPVPGGGRDPARPEGRAAAARG